MCYRITHNPRCFRMLQFIFIFTVFILHSHLLSIPWHCVLKFYASVLAFLYFDVHAYPSSMSSWWRLPLPFSVHVLNTSHIIEFRCFIFSTWWTYLLVSSSIYYDICSLRICLLSCSPKCPSDSSTHFLKASHQSLPVPSVSQVIHRR